MKKISGTTVIGIVFAIASCIALYVTNTTITATSLMGDPGPTIFPNAVCVIILILALIIIFQSFKNPEHAFAGTLSTDEGRQGLIRMLLILADLALFVILWSKIPFVVAGFIFLFIQCMVFREKLLFSVIYSAGVTGALYAIFTIGLKVTLNI